MSNGSEIPHLSEEESTFFQALYKDLHQNPGLSFQETYAADIAEKFLVEYGYTVTSKIAGYGLIGVMKRGPGKTILLRADMDGLPVGELTGLPYASQKRQIDSDGIEKPVMHACGHDVHVGKLRGRFACFFLC
jgi:metal-dependent amidase/aminoacylase/carboxypeptidase family protein